jgi:CTP:molybdopterin cytidylyltransferase MocA
LQELEGLSVRVDENSGWRTGMGGSIAIGVSAQSAAVDGVLLLLCDQYRINLPDLERLAGAWATAPGRIVAARWGAAFGPPVIFPRAFFARLMRLSGDLGARQILVEERANVRFMDLDNAAYDVDKPDDLAKMREFEAA